MHTRHVSFVVLSGVLINTLFVCCVSQIFNRKSVSPQATPTATESSQESLKHPTESSQEGQKPIVGDWQQIQFQGVGGRSNISSGGYIWYGDYFYVGTYNQGNTLPQVPGNVGGGGSSGGGGSTSVCPANAACPTSQAQGGKQPTPGGQGTGGTKTGAEIWRTQDGTNWEVVGEPGLGYPNVTIFQPVLFQNHIHVFAGMQPFLLVSSDGQTFELVNGGWSNGVVNNNILQNYLIENALLVSGGSSQKGLQAWLSTDGKGFETVIKDGLGDMKNYQMCGNTTESLNGWYYLGVMNNASGGEIWRTKDGHTWEKSLTAGYDNPVNYSLCSALINDGYLYVTIPGSYQKSPKHGVEVIRSADGKNWEKVIENGFGLGVNQAFSGSFKVYKEAIYFILSNYPPQSDGPASTGFSLLKSTDGKKWEKVGKPGFDNTNSYSGNLYVIRDVFYLVANNKKDGNQIWRSTDGTNWESFHTFPASPTSIGNHLAELADGLEYFGYDTELGIQIWRYGQ